MTGSSFRVSPPPKKKKTSIYEAKIDFNKVWRFKNIQISYISF
jgi:hypothetical protein